MNERNGVRLERKEARACGAIWCSFRSLRSSDHSASHPSFSTGFTGYAGSMRGLASTSLQFLRPSVLVRAEGGASVVRTPRGAGLPALLLQLPRRISDSASDDGAGTTVRARQHRMRGTQPNKAMKLTKLSPAPGPVWRCRLMP